MALSRAQTESPLKLLDIIARPKYTGLEISPDGKYFAGVAMTEEGKTMLHILDRQTMAVVHSEIYWRPAGRRRRQLAGQGQPPDRRHLQERARRRGGRRRPVHVQPEDQEHPARVDRRRHGGLGGSEGAQIGDRIDDQHHWLTVGPSGSTYSEIPFVYLYKLNVFTGRATKVMKSPSRGASFVFNNDNEVTHAVGILPDDFDSTVVHKRVNGEWVLEGSYASPKGISVPVRWHKTDPDKILYMDTLDASTIGYYWVDAKTGKKELIYRDPRVDIDRIFFNEEDEAVALMHNYDYPTFVVLQPEDPLTKRRQRYASPFPDHMVTIDSSTADGFEHVLRVSSDRSRSVFYLWNEYDGTIRPLLDPRPWMKAENVPQTHAVKFKARDGMELVGYLTVPVHKNMRDLPLIILPHGGPHGPRDFWGTTPSVAAFANAGYAVLAINYRGSGGYGGNSPYDWYGRWGTEMQEDLEDACPLGGQGGHRGSPSGSASTAHRTVVTRH